eukprot:3151554-Amphidinium_carterae.1
MSSTYRNHRMHLATSVLERERGANRKSTHAEYHASYCHERHMREGEEPFCYMFMRDAPPTIARTTLQRYSCALSFGLPHQDARSSCAFRVSPCSPSPGRQHRMCLTLLEGLVDVHCHERQLWHGT